MLCQLVLCGLVLAAPALSFGGDAANTKIQRPFLWKITRTSTADSAAKPHAYLFGTIHVPNKNVTQLHPTAQRAWYESTAAFFEIDFLKNSDDQTAAISLPDGQKLEDLVPPDTLQRLDARLKKISPLMSRTALPNAKIAVWPLLLGNLDAQMRDLGQLPMDLKLFQEARSKSKLVGGLEQATSQLKTLVSLTNEEQLAFLKGTLDGMDDDDAKNIDRLSLTIELYASGDAEKFRQFIDEDLKRSTISDELRDKIIQGLLVDRNKLMAESIAKNMQQSSDRIFFFAVGVGHLVGKDSVQDFLKSHDMTIERVSADNSGIE